LDLLLNAGFGAPLLDADLAWIRSLGFAGIRTDILPDASLEIVRRQLRQLRRQGLKGLLLFSTDSTPERVQQITELASGMPGLDFSIELGNEEELGEWDSFSYLRWIKKCVSRVGIGVETLAGSIHRLTYKTLKYAWEVIPFMPPHVVAALHPYRTHTTQSDPEWLDLYNEWRTMLGKRRFAITEIGWHTAPRSQRFPFCWKSERWMDGDVARFAQGERKLWRAEGAKYLVWYQFRDGANGNNDQHRFGIRDINGNPKQVSQVWA
jgi:hypothetical protein